MADQITVTVKIVRNGRASSSTLVRPFTVGGNPTKRKKETRVHVDTVATAAIVATWAGLEEN